MESFATPYPVIFNDGDQEQDKGVVGIHSLLTFKRFQSMVAQKTGLPAAQLSAVFVCKRIVGGTEKKQKLPVNENTNFAIILAQHNALKEKDCFFLVAMKRSKKDRKQLKKKVEPEVAEDDAMVKKDSETPLADLTDENAELPKQQDHQKPAGMEGVEDVSRASACELLMHAKSDDVPAEARKALKLVTNGVVDTQPQSAWRSGSILQRLSSGELKATEVDTRPTPDVHAPHVPPGLVKAENTGGMISPTSVLESGQLRLPPQIGHTATAWHPTQENPSFSLFGQGPHGAELHTLLQDAVIANMQLRRPKCCRFCAFCRERSVSIAPFHWCPDDQVVPGFKGPNPAGPIGARAVKQRVAAA